MTSAGTGQKITQMTGEGDDSLRYNFQSLRTLSHISNCTIAAW